MEFITLKDIKYYPNRTKITLHLTEKYRMTGDFDRFSQLLIGKLPGIMLHKCKNSGKKPVAEELENTETAHALEHILIELIFLIDTDVERVSGVTAWNWKQQPEGTYHINLTYTDKLILEKCLQEGLLLLDKTIVEKTFLPDFGGYRATIA